ncbi:MAG: hypothetical protein QOE35_1750 [Actinomycetota bacterium]|jgi:hypothetical protein
MPDPELATRLRDHIGGAVPPITIAELLGRRRPDRHRRTTGLLAAGAVIVVVVVALVAAAAVWSDDAGRRVTLAPLSTSARAFRSGPVGVELVWADGDTLMAGDPKTGAARPIDAPAAWCGTCQLVRVGPSLFYGGTGATWRLDPPSYVAQQVETAQKVFPAARANAVYVADASGASPNGNHVRLVTVDGAPLGGPWDLPTGYSLTDPPRALATGIVVASPANSFPQRFATWDPGTGRVGRAIGTGGRVIDTFSSAGRSLVAWTREPCQESCDLVITDVAKEHDVAVRRPATDRGFIGGGGFSPDGSTLAAFSVLDAGNVGGDAGGRRMRLALVDARSGRVTLVAGAPAEFGEDYGFATWSPDGRWVFFGGLHEVYAHRVGTADAVRVMLPPTYSMTAVRR